MRTPDHRGGFRDEDEDDPVPGEQPVNDEPLPIAHASVPPLTEPDDTEGG